MAMTIKILLVIGLMSFLVTSMKPANALDDVAEPYVFHGYLVRGEVIDVERGSFDFVAREFVDSDRILDTKVSIIHVYSGPNDLVGEEFYTSNAGRFNRAPQRRENRGYGLDPDAFRVGDVGIWRLGTDEHRMHHHRNMRPESVLQFRWPVWQREDDPTWGRAMRFREWEQLAEAIELVDSAMSEANRLDVLKERSLSGVPEVAIWTASTFTRMDPDEARDFFWSHVVHVVADEADISIAGVIGIDESLSQIVNEDWTRSALRFDLYREALSKSTIDGHIAELLWHRLWQVDEQSEDVWTAEQSIELFDAVQGNPLASSRARSVGLRFAVKAAQIRDDDDVLMRAMLGVITDTDDLEHALAAIRYLAQHTSYSEQREATVHAALSLRFPELVEADNFQFIMTIWRRSADQTDE